MHPVRHPVLRLVRLGEGAGEGEGEGAGEGEGEGGAACSAAERRVACSGLGLGLRLGLRFKVTLTQTLALTVACSGCSIWMTLTNSSNSIVPESSASICGGRCTADAGEMQGRCRGDAGEIGGTDLRGGSGAFGQDAPHGFAQHQQPLLGPPGPRGMARVPECTAQEGWRKGGAGSAPWEACACVALARGCGTALMQLAAPAAAKRCSTLAWLSCSPSSGSRRAKLVRVRGRVRVSVPIRNLTLALTLTLT